ncbi:30S ribosomal protein S18 [candidate division KSB1 bacterium]
MLRPKYSKKICRFCENQINFIDYRDDKKLLKFTTEQGKIIPRRISGTCARHQRMLVRTIKRARQLAIIPYISDIAR